MRSDFHEYHVLQSGESFLDMVLCFVWVGRASACVAIVAEFLPFMKKNCHDVAIACQWVPGAHLFRLGTAMDELALST